MDDNKAIKIGYYNAIKCDLESAMGQVDEILRLLLRYNEPKKSSNMKAILGAQFWKWQRMFKN